jgi:hypothetical protein
MMISISSRPPIAGLTGKPVSSAPVCLCGTKRTSGFAIAMSVNDAVDGATLRHRSAIGWLREANHVEGSRHGQG